MNGAVLIGFVAGCGLLKLRSILILWFCFAVSDANVLVESELCDIAFPKDLFGVVSPFSTAL